MNLDIIPNGAIKRVHVSQNDVGRTLTFELFNNSARYNIPSGAVIKIQGTKPNGLGFSETCTVNNNLVTVDTTEAMTEVSGNIPTELSIAYNDVVLGTSNFILSVEKNPHPEGTVDGIGVNPVIENLEVIITNAVDEWLDEHPEATTTVVDGSITEKKLSDDLKNKVNVNKIIFMPVDHGKDITVSGESTCIITTKGTVILNDTGYTHSYDLIKAELTDANVTKIDYMIISHFHGDHINNLSSLQSDFDMSNTIYYLPKIPISFTGNNFSTDDYNTVISLIGSNTIVRPNNLQELIIDDVTFTFFNCGDDDVTFYDSTTNDYNNYSMCFYLTCGQNKVLFTGDIQAHGERRVYDQGYLSKVELLSIPHHGWDLSATFDFYLTTNPKYSVFSLSTDQLGTQQGTYGKRQQYLDALGSEIYCLGKATVYAYFNEKDLYVVSDANTFDVSEYNRPVCHIYVNSAYSANDSDGSVSKPFTTLTEAVAFAKRFKWVDVQIDFIGTYTSEETIVIASMPTLLTITACSVSKIDIFDSHVNLDGVTITGTMVFALYCLRSNVYLNNVIINGDTTSVSDIYQGRGFTFYQSQIHATTLTISNKAIAMGAYNNSRYNITTLNGSNNLNAFINESGSYGYAHTVNLTYTDKLYLPSQRAIDNPLANVLKNGDNLNDYTVAGEYLCTSYAQARTLVNAPPNIAFGGILKVETNNNYYYTQIWISNNASRNGSEATSTDVTGIFYRVTVGGTWSNWWSVGLTKLT